MRNIDHFRSCLNSALDRRYFVDKWIGDQSLVSILEQNYDMDFMSKKYFNKYIDVVYLKEYNFYSKVIHKIKNSKNELTRATFYYFTKTSSIPTYFSTKNDWQKVYNNFRVLRCITNQSNKRKVDKLNDSVNLSTTNDCNIVSPSPPDIVTNF